jgi:ABC-type amino acid transport substrate-binding protein
MTGAGAQAGLAAAALALALPCAAVGQEAPELRPLRVAVVEAPPFVMPAPNGGWQGVSLDVWDAVARTAGWSYVVSAADVEGALNGLEAGTIDVAIGAIGITADRERRVDFSHPYFLSSLAVATPESSGTDLASIRGVILSRAFLAAVGTMAVLVFAFGILVWAAERRANPRAFGPVRRGGILGAFWWALVTMTTVGYGDKVPVTPLGRILASVWMFVAMVLVALITGHVAASLTSERLATPATALSELRQLRVGVLEASAAGETLTRMGVRPTAYPGIEAAFAALDAGEIDGVLADAAFLEWARGSGPALSIRPLAFEPAGIGIALPPGSAMREPLNRALLDLVESGRWIEILQRYGVGTVD